MRRIALLLVPLALLVAAALAGSCDSQTTTPAAPPVGGPPVASGPAAPVKLPPPSAVFVVSPTCRDRFEPEPCNRLGSGGLLSVRAFQDRTEELMPRAIGVFMGDLSMARGEYGRKTLGVFYDAVIPETGIKIVSAGIGELQHGSAWVRDHLRRMHDPKQLAILCANATTPDGGPILLGSDVARASAGTDPMPRNALVVAVAADSLQDELIARGSDVRLTPAAEAIPLAVKQGLERAAAFGAEVHTRVLLVQGTVEEAVALVEAVPGFDFAVASRGPILPELKPRMAGSVPVYYGGQGMRFGWRISVDGTGPEGVYGTLVRFGTKLLSLGSPYRGVVEDLARVMAPGTLEMAAANPSERPAHRAGTFVGAAMCKECHPQEYDQHRASAHWRSPAAMLDAPNATSTACTTCHVTAPFFRGGWSPKTPFEDFSGISCESCHGPGSEHAAAPNAGWGAVDLASCTRCHLPERTPGFDARTLWRDFGHRLAK